MKSSGLEVAPIWTDLIPGQSESLEVSVGDHAYGWGTLLHGDNGSQFRIEWYGTDDNYVRKGFGKTLLETMAKEASNKGAETLVAHAASEASLATFAKTFGPERIDLYDRGTHQASNVPLDQAMQHPDRYNIEVSLR